MTTSSKVDQPSPPTSVASLPHDLQVRVIGTFHNPALFGRFCERYRLDPNKFTTTEIAQIAREADTASRTGGVADEDVFRQAFDTAMLKAVYGLMQQAALHGAPTETLFKEGKHQVVILAANAGLCAVEPAGPKAFDQARYEVMQRTLIKKYGPLPQPAPAKKNASPTVTPSAPSTPVAIAAPTKKTDVDFFADKKNQQAAYVVDKSISYAVPSASPTPRPPPSAQAGGVNIGSAAGPKKYHMYRVSFVGDGNTVIRTITVASTRYIGNVDKLKARVAQALRDQTNVSEDDGSLVAFDDKPTILASDEQPEIPGSREPIGLSVLQEMVSGRTGTTPVIESQPYDTQVPENVYAWARTPGATAPDTRTPPPLPTQPARDEVRHPTAAQRAAFVKEWLAVTLPAQIAAGTVDTTIAREQEKAAKIEALLKSSDVLFEAYYRERPQLMAQLEAATDPNAKAAIVFLVNQLDSAAARLNGLGDADQDKVPAAKTAFASAIREANPAVEWNIAKRSQEVFFPTFDRKAAAAAHMEEFRVTSGLYRRGDTLAKKKQRMRELTSDREKLEPLADGQQNELRKTDNMLKQFAASERIFSDYHTMRAQLMKKAEQTTDLEEQKVCFAQIDRLDAVAANVATSYVPAEVEQEQAALTSAVNEGNAILANWKAHAHDKPRDYAGDIFDFRL